jgi:hypothetical protein
MGLHPHIGNFFHTENFFNIYTKFVLVTIAQLKPQRTYFPLCTAHGYHIYRTQKLIHLLSLLCIFLL